MTHGEVGIRWGIQKGVAKDRDGALLWADPVNDRVVRWRDGAREGEVVAGGNGQGSRLHICSFDPGGGGSCRGAGRSGVGWLPEE